MRGPPPQGSHAWRVKALVTRINEMIGHISEVGLSAILGRPARPFHRCFESPMPAYQWGYWFNSSVTHINQEQRRYSPFNAFSAVYFALKIGALNYTREDNLYYNLFAKWDKGHCISKRLKFYGGCHKSVKHRFCLLRCVYKKDSVHIYGNLRVWLYVVRVAACTTYTKWELTV